MSRIAQGFVWFVKKVAFLIACGLIVAGMVSFMMLIKNYG